MSVESRISPFIRPALLTTGATGAFGIAVTAGIIEIFSPGTGLRFGDTVMDILVQVPDPVFDLFGLMFGAYALGKSGERAAHMWTGARENGAGGAAPAGPEPKA